MNLQGIQTPFTVDGIDGSDAVQKESVGENSELKKEISSVLNVEDETSSLQIGNKKGSEKLNSAVLNTQNLMNMLSNETQRYNKEEKEIEKEIQSKGEEYQKLAEEIQAKQEEYEKLFDEWFEASYPVNTYLRYIESKNISKEELQEILNKINAAPSSVQSKLATIKSLVEQKLANIK